MENEEQIAELAAAALRPGVPYNTKLYLGAQIAKLMRPEVGANKRAAALIRVDHNNISFLRATEHRDPVNFQRLINNEVTVRSVMVRYRPNNKPHPTTDKIVALTAQGFTTQTIAERLNIAVQRVRLLANKKGMELIEDTRPKLDSERVLNGLLMSLHSLAMDADVINVCKLDEAGLEGWLKDLNKSLTPFRRLRQQLRNRYENGETRKAQ